MFVKTTASTEELIKVLEGLNYRDKLYQTTSQEGHVFMVFEDVALRSSQTMTIPVYIEEYTSHRILHFLVSVGDGKTGLEEGLITLDFGARKNRYKALLKTLKKEKITYEVLQVEGEKTLQV